MKGVIFHLRVECVYECVDKGVYKCVCLCVREREREREREKYINCVRVSHLKRCVCVCVREGDKDTETL